MAVTGDFDSMIHSFFSCTHAFKAYLRSIAAWFRLIKPISTVLEPYEYSNKNYCCISLLPDRSARRASTPFQFPEDPSQAFGIIGKWRF